MTNLTHERKFNVAPNIKDFIKSPIIGVFFIVLFMLSSASVNAQCTDFDLSLWTTSQVNGPHGGAVNTSGAPGSIAITGSDDFLNITTGTEINYCITITTPGNISFDWVYASANSDAGWDPFFFTLNGVGTQLTLGFPGSVNQNGTETVAVTTGDVFCFSQRSVDDVAGAATTTISNLAYPCIEESIPTMSEWGLMIFGLLTMNLGLITLRRKEEMFGRG